MAKISVVIPVYNVEKYLRNTLDSVINQTFKNIEIICVDDGSTDASYKILEEYHNKDNRFIIIKQQHKNAGAARNTGLKTATGDYIYFLDSDDYFKPEMFEEMLNIAEHFNADIVVCNAEKKLADGSVDTKSVPFILPNCPINKPFCWRDYPQEIFRMFTPAPWNKLYSMDLIRKYNLGFQSIECFNDTSFAYAIRIFAQRIVVLDKSFIDYRKFREGCITSTYSKYVINIAKCFNLTKDILEANGVYKPLKRGLIRAFREHVLSLVQKLDDEQYDKFLSEFKQMLPNDYKMFASAFRTDYITPSYLKVFLNGKKVVFWGASLYIKKIIESADSKMDNVIGIIDKNPNLSGKMIGGYRVFLPDNLDILNPDYVLLTVKNNWEEIYPELKEYLEKNYPNIKLLPNIYDFSNM